VNQVTIVSQTGNPRMRIYASAGHADKRRVFRAAIRHSRLVRFLRIGIPAGIALAALATMMAATVLDPLRALTRLPVDISGLVISGTKITMQQPRLAGFTQDRRAYVVTARAAAQDVTNPNSVELQELHAKIEMKDSDAFEMTARVGLFETQADRLTLNDNILVSSENFQARMSEAVINVRTSQIVSEKPVEVTMPQGTINANRLEVTNSGSVIRFERGVIMVLTPANDPTDSKAETR
jgi:lipopolysaccharide export system protein LptC